MRPRRFAIALAAITAVALLAAGVATASAPPKPVASNSVPVSGIVVTKVSVGAAVQN